MSEDKGVVYGVSGLPWIQETILSGLSLRKTNPELPSELVIDQDTYRLLEHEINIDQYFSYINVIPELHHSRSLKFEALLSKRFKKCLFLDGDTFITDDIGELFDLLDKFDIGAMIAQQRVNDKSIEAGIQELFPYIPISFPEYNTGVIVYNNHEGYRTFIEEWIKLYHKALEEKDYRMDQATFRPTLYFSNLRLATLTPEYNLRAGVPNVVRGKVKIVHAHGHLDQIASMINIREQQIRMWTPKPGFVHGFSPKNNNPHDQDSLNTQKVIISEIKSMLSRLERGGYVI